MAKNEEFHVRAEINRVQLEARLATQPEHLKDAVESLALCVLALMDSFGVHDIRVIQSQIERPDGQKPGYVFEQLDQGGRTIKRAAVVAPSIALAEDGAVE